jgi:feruloyl esterase
MRADTTLFASLLVASAAAQNMTGPSNSTSIDNSYNKKIVAELEAEVEALKHQLEAAQTETCDASPVNGGSASSSSGSSPAGYSGNKGTATGPAAVTSSAPAFYTGEDESADKPAGDKPAGYTGQTNTGSNSGSNSGSSSGSNSGSASGVESSSEGTSDAGKAEQDGSYYAPNAPKQGAKSTSTVTVIVTAAQTETVQLTQTRNGTAVAYATGATGNVHSSVEASATGDVVIVTATETYCGKGAIPTPGQPISSMSDSPAAHASSQLSSVLSATRPASYSSSAPSSVISNTQGYFGNGTAPYGQSSGFLTATRGASSGLELTSSVSSSMGTAVSSSAIPTGTGISSVVRPVGTGVIGTAVSSSTSSSASPSATASISDCATFCEELTTFNGWDVTPLTCTQRAAGVAVDTPVGQSSVSCATSFTPTVDLCQVTLKIKTSGTAETYSEVWLPNGNTTEWNGRSMNTDNGGLNGCIHYVDMSYVTGLGFAAIGDNAGHNGSSFDGTWTLNNNEAIIDWSYRARHAAVEVGKETIDQFYSKAADYSYYIGCSAGGAQGVQSAEKYPNDFDGIIAGAAANDFNHLQGWSAHFLELTGAVGTDTFLTSADWVTVQTAVLAQCDELIDGVADGILEDPTQCKLDSSKIPVCSSTVTSACLTSTQIETVDKVFQPLYSDDGALIYPALFPGSQVDAFKLGLLSGTPQGIARDWFRGAVFNDSSYDISKISAADIALGQSLDNLHGNPSAFSAELSGFRDAGKKFMMYHGMADPMTSGANAQRYYLKLASKLGASNTDLDSFFRLFRISGMAHCGVGGISGAGAWQFGQNGAASSATNNIVSNLVDWVENDNAPETLLGTKFWYDTPAYGVMFERAHCRFPFRTTFVGGDADSTLPESWTCEEIPNWRDCADEFCSADGTFT